MKGPSWTVLRNKPDWGWGVARPSCAWCTSGWTSRKACDARRGGFDKASFGHYCDGVLQLKTNEILYGFELNFKYNTGSFHFYKVVGGWISTWICMFNFIQVQKGSLDTACTGSWAYAVKGDICRCFTCKCWPRKLFSVCSVGTDLRWVHTLG